jgi:hypothetical protein
MRKELAPEALLASCAGMMVPERSRRLRGIGSALLFAAAVVVVLIPPIRIWEIAFAVLIVIGAWSELHWNVATFIIDADGFECRSPLPFMSWRAGAADVRGVVLHTGWGEPRLSIRARRTRRMPLRGEPLARCAAAAG